jgi:PAS domain S-box-containing protein
MSIKDLLEGSDFFPEPMALLSREGVIDAVNRPFAEQLEMAPDSLVGKRLEALAASSAAAIEEYLRACLATHEVVQGSLLLRRRADAVALRARAVRYSPSPTASVSQVVLRLAGETMESGVNADVTRTSAVDPVRWREIEASLRHQSQILEVTLASIGDAVMITDLHGRMTFMNSVAETLTGWTTEQAKGRTLNELVRFLNEYTREAADDIVSNVLRTGATQGLANHTLLVTRNHREIPIAHSAAPIRAPNGDLFGIVLVLRDVTAERNAERDQAWLAAIVDSSSDAIVSKTLEGRITSWNPAATQLFGYSAAEAIGKPITLIIPPELHDEERQLLQRLRAGERVEHLETVRVDRSGRRVEVSLTVSPVRDRSGHIVGASKIARDIGRRKQLERMSREAERRKDEFLATLSHELRNPLGPLRSASDVLCQAEHPDPALQTACAIVDRQLRQLTRLVDDLMDVSRVSTGTFQLIKEKFDLAGLLLTVRASLIPAFNANRQTLRLVLPDQPLWVEADRTRLVQVFMNLLTNANKYTPDGGSIEVEGQQQPGRISVTIRDTGIGIAPDMLEQVFELFSQVDRSSHRTRGGLGIGLTLSKRLLHAHGGTISAHSEGLGKGSEFVVELPASPPPPSVVAAAARTAGQHPQVKRKVLIADDNVDAAVSLSILLEGVGHETRVAHDGVHALDLAEEFQPDVAILDLGMPGLDGYETARRLRERPWSQATLLIALTGWGADADRELTQRAGFDAHFVKPADLEALAQLILRARTS